MKNVKRKLAFASIMLCGSVALGLASLNDATVSASAETLDGFEVKSASLRVPDDNYGAGIRFTIGLGNVNLAEGATTGVLLIPTSSLGSNALTLDFSHDDLRTYDNLQWKNFADGTKEAYLHLYDVPPVQYTSNISICAYVDTPDADPIYSNVVTASVAEVADWAYYNDTTLDETAKASLQSTYLTGKVVYHNEDQVWDETSAIYNQTITEADAPERDGYVFAGWWNQAGTHKWDFDTTKVTSRTTNLYAKWILDYSAAGTGDWSIGETTFTGAAVIRGPFGDETQSGLYPMGDGVKMTLGAHSYAGFEAKFKTNIDATLEDKYVSFTAKGADASLFTIVQFNASGTAFTGATKACVTRMEANGYTTYVFRIAKGNTVSKFRVTPLGNTTETGKGSEIIISNCTIGDYSSLRTGEDANTLFFYDTPLAVTLGNMYYKANNNHQTVAYSTEKAYGDERGSTKVGGIKYGSNAYCLYKTNGAALSSADQAFLQEGDYLVFNVYSTAPRKLFFSVMASGANYPTTGHKLMPNTWTRIVIPASVFAATGSYYFLINHIVSDSTVSGSLYDLYFSKIVRCPASEVTNLANNATTDTWTVGSTTFTGAPSVSNSAAGSGVLVATEYKKPYLVNGELILTFTRANDPYINLKLANSMAVTANSEVYVTVVMYNYGRLDQLEGYINSKYKFSYVSQEDVGGGYAKVTFKCTVSTDCDITNVRLDAESHSDTTMATQFVIKDIAITTK